MSIGRPLPATNLDATQLFIQSIGIILGLVGISIAFANFYRKSGMSIKAKIVLEDSTETLSSNIYISKLYLFNLKDKSEAIYSILLKLDNMHYLPLRDFSHDPEILKAFEVMLIPFQRVSSYKLESQVVNINNAIRNKDRVKLILSTPSGLSTIPFEFIESKNLSLSGDIQTINLYPKIKSYSVDNAKHFEDHIIIRITINKGKEEAYFVNVYESDGSYCIDGEDDARISILISDVLRRNLPSRTDPMQVIRTNEELTSLLNRWLRQRYGRSSTCLPKWINCREEAIQLYQKEPISTRIIFSRKATILLGLAFIFLLTLAVLTLR